MPGLKKRLYSTIFLILLHVVGTVGVFSAYFTCYHRIAFQRNVKETPNTDLLKLAFTEKEYLSIQWVEKGTEFEWQGKMYDVSKISRTEKGYVMVCRNDSFEEMLLSFLKVAKRSQGQDTKKGNPQPQFFCSFYSFSLKSMPKQEKRVMRIGCPCYCSIQPETSSPPPESCFS